MLIGDKASIDYRPWFKLKHTCSIDLVDRSDPRNDHIISDHLVVTSLWRDSAAHSLHQSSGRRDLHLSHQRQHPGQLSDRLALQTPLGHQENSQPFKSKMVERKFWANFPEFKQSHAIFECLARKLFLLFRTIPQPLQRLALRIGGEKTVRLIQSSGLHPRRRKLHQHRTSKSYPAHRAIHPVGAYLNLQTDSQGDSLNNLNNFPDKKLLQPRLSFNNFPDKELPQTKSCPNLASITSDRCGKLS